MLKEVCLAEEKEVKRQELNTPQLAEISAKQFYGS